MLEEPHYLIVGLFLTVGRIIPANKAWDKAQSLDEFPLTVLSRGSGDKKEWGCSVKPHGLGAPAGSP